MTMMVMIFMIRPTYVRSISLFSKIEFCWAPHTARLCEVLTALQAWSGVCLLYSLPAVLYTQLLLLQTFFVIYSLNRPNDDDDGDDLYHNKDHHHHRRCTMNVHRSVWRRFCCFLTFFFEIKQPADFFVTLSRDPLPVGTWMSCQL